MMSLHVLLVLLALFAAGTRASGDAYLVGTGKADITGPAADVNLMGYASPSQLAAGIHTRLYARAFLVADAADSSNRFVFVNMDACMAAQAVTIAVHKRLQALYGGLYTQRNVVLSGIHTHSGPGGYLQYVLYTITSLGFVRESFDTLVDGVVEAIEQAHASLAPGRLQANVGELLGANANRSPTAYLANPADERALYEHNTDKAMTLLKVLDDSGRGRGAVAWFPVHCTSINNTNALISGDNKGVASQLLEAWADNEAQDPSTDPVLNIRSPGRDGILPGFVAAFGQANVGDTSPNVLGAFCADTGEPCEAQHSTCGGRTELCIGRGPAWDVDDFGFRSNEVIARRQAEAAAALWLGSSNAQPLNISGPVDARHAYVDMSAVEVAASNWTRAGRTCSPAMGFSFAGGTTDGPGAFDFRQGDTNGTAFWRLVRHFIHEPSAAQAACHAPKPILLDTGSLTIPYAWQPSIVDIQILRAGQLVVLCVPAELTTMAGRRLREAVRARVAEAWGPDVRVVIAGLANTYSSYVATFEEYGVQRYEGASTIFGPHTLDAYIQEFLRLAGDMVAGRETPPGPPPPDLLPRQWSFLGPVVLDTVPHGASFGGVVSDAAAAYAPNDTARAVFHSACPRNNVRRGGTFLAVERQDDADGAWRTVLTDDHRSTRFAWARPHTLSSESTAAISWDIPASVQPGVYRLRHFGDYKHILGGTQAFEGASRSFCVALSARACLIRRTLLGLLAALRAGRLWRLL